MQDSIHWQRAKRTTRSSVESYIPWAEWRGRAQWHISPRPQQWWCRHSLSEQCGSGAADREAGTGICPPETNQKLSYYTDFSPIKVSKFDKTWWLICAVSIPGGQSFYFGVCYIWNIWCLAHHLSPWKSKVCQQTMMRHQTFHHCSK